METMIEKYNQLHKSMVSGFTDEHKAEAYNLKNNSHNSLESINWSDIHQAIYMIEVGEVAKKNFLEFGLEGCFGHQELLGRYLRLFGFLNAVFQQKVAIEKLLEAYQIKELERISSILSNSAIIDLCNKVGAHTTNVGNHSTFSDHQFRVYEISRSHSGANQDKQLIIKFEFGSYNLLSELNLFDKKVELTLSFMISEILKNVFNHEGEFYE